MKKCRIFLKGAKYILLKDGFTHLFDNLGAYNK